MTSHPFRPEYVHGAPAVPFAAEVHSTPDEKAATDLLAALELAALPLHQGEPNGFAPLLIDLRSRRRYLRSHVPGSHNIPAGQLISGELPAGDLILIGETSQESAEVIDHLHAQGYPQRILHLSGGFSAWADLGMPVENENEGTFRPPSWENLRNVLGGSLLLVAAAATQSLALLALGVVLLFGPLVHTRARA